MINSKSWIGTIKIGLTIGGFTLIFLVKNQVFGMTSKIFQTNYQNWGLSHWDRWWWRSSDCASETSCRNGSSSHHHRNGVSSDWTTNNDGQNGVFSNQTASTAGQNDCFGYQTFGTAHQNNSSDNGTPSPIARVAASVTRPLALVGEAAAPTTKLLALAT